MPWESDRPETYFSNRFNSSKSKNCILCKKPSTYVYLDSDVYCSACLKLDKFHTTKDLCTVLYGLTKDESLLKIVGED